ncbi:MAG: EamA family transporter [Nitrospinae bacterium]|nr:EamA family transporter [Nitrospinota bacterium]
MIIKNYNLLIGIFFYAIATLIFIPALKFGELSVLYPFVATVYIWTTLFSIKFLNENMNKWKWFGIIFIILGVSLIGFGS